VGFNWSGIEPRPGVIDDGYVRSLLGTVRTLGAHGIYSLLDVHQDGYGPETGTDGAPNWATLTDGAPNTHLGFGPDYFANPALLRAFDNLFGNASGPGGAGVADRYGAMLAALGRVFRNEPYLLGYELINEPYPGSQYATCMNPAGCPVFDAQLSAFYRRVTSALRKADTTHLVFDEPNLFFDFGSNTNLSDPSGSDPRTGFAFHDYCLGAGAGDALPPIPGSGPGCAVEEQQVFDDAIAYASRSGSGLINTEWAATDDMSAVARVADELDANRIPWTYWNYNSPRFVKDPSKPPSGANVNAQALAILDRPYPRAVAGSPESWRWDSMKRTFSLSYSTAPPAGVHLSPTTLTEIWVGRLHFPNGYRVKVTGASAVSRPGADLLTLRARRGARPVTVEISPAGG
jgi:endoglycosylceramidase